MLSTGQQIFAVVFICAFIVAMVFAYSSDLKQRKDLFKGTWVTMAIIGVVIILFVMIRYVFKAMEG